MNSLDVAALTALGRRKLIGEGLAAAPQEGLALLTDAAARDGAEAHALLALLAGFGLVRDKHLPAALEHLTRAAELGWNPARLELQFLAGVRSSDWRALRGRVDIAALTTPRAERVLYKAPAIRAIDGFASRAECEWLIARGRNGLKRALVYRQDAEGHTASETRTNSEADYTLTRLDLVVAMIRERLAAATGSPTTHFEAAKLLHYEPGQQFGLHADYQDPSNPVLAAHVQRHGQRVTTALIYLNDDYDGGETDFPRIDLRFRGKRGEALIFSNVTAAGDPDVATAHAGIPPTRGAKWVYSQWIRAKPVS
jgi:TPR repeat protein